MAAVNKVQVKCVVWDLDNTLWQGTLLEDGAVQPHSHMLELIHALDDRGVLQSVASRGDEQLAMSQLVRLGLDQIVLHPHISLADKSAAVGTIIRQLDIGADTVVFVDDDAFERAEVYSVHPEVQCLAPDELQCLQSIAEQPLDSFTAEARARRQYYKENLMRSATEARFEGDDAAFRRDLGMCLTLRDALPEDLPRLGELLARTNQMNSAGRFVEPAQIGAFIANGNKSVLVAEYGDRFGQLGVVGMVLLDRTVQAWTIELMLVSCRVLSRGVGMAVLAQLARLAGAAGVRLLSHFTPNERNRVMALTLGMAGFSALTEGAEHTVLECDLQTPPVLPAEMRWQLDIASLCAAESAPC